MNTKLLEIRDEGTFVPVMCVDMNPDSGLVGNKPARPLDVFESQRYLLRRCGYPCDGQPNIAMTRHLRCSGEPISNDPWFWGGRTFPVAHKYIVERWADLKDGDVVDVQFILGETSAPKVSERIREVQS